MRVDASRADKVRDQVPDGLIPETVARNSSSRSSSELRTNIESRTAGSTCAKMEEIFKTFLSDARAYEGCRTTWGLLWQRIPAPCKASWKSPWLNTTFEDGSELRDGDGIFSAWSESSKRALCNGSR